MQGDPTNDSAASFAGDPLLKVIRDREISQDAQAAKLGKMRIPV
jgi:hypothetical protein